MSIRFHLLALIALPVLIAGCQNGEPETFAEAEPPPPMAEEPQMSPTPDRPSLEETVDLAINDLADRLGVEADNIEVVDARNVTWRNGALGCPEEDMMYTQALVDGRYVRLRAEGETHYYHAGRDGRPFACPAKRSEQPPEDSAALR